MRNLKQLQEEQRQQYSHLIPAMEEKQDQPSRLQRFLRSLMRSTGRLFPQRPGMLAPSESIPSPLSPSELLVVKQMLLQQQQLSQRLLTQIDQLHVHPHITKQKETKEDNYQLDELKRQLAQREEEVRQLQTQQMITEKLHSKLEQVQEAFSLLQERMRGMEAQADQASMLAMELEDAKAAYHQLSGELARKSQKLQQVVGENIKLQQHLSETEDKLVESNFQRQQLLKRVHLLEEVNHELQLATDTNKKLQAELRRIGELESMLNIITEERNQLLGK